MDIRVFGSINNAVSAGIVNSVLVVTKSSAAAKTTYPLTGSVTIPASDSLIIENGAAISNGTGHFTLTINGPFSAGLYRVFSGFNKGDVTFSGNGTVKRIIPQWWGAIGDGSTNSTDAIQDAINAALSANTAVYLPGGTYVTTDTLTANADYFMFLGAGIGASDRGVTTAPAVIQYNGNGIALEIGDSTNKNKHAGALIQDIRINGNASAAAGVQLNYIDNSFFNRVTLSDFSGAESVALELAHECQCTAINDSVITNNTNGVWLEDRDNSTWFFATLIQNNTGYGLRIGQVASGISSTGVKFSDSVCEFNNRNIVLDAASNFTAEGSYFEDNANSELSITVGDITNSPSTPYTRNTVIRDSYFGGNSIASYAILMSGGRAYDLVVEGCEFSNYTTAVINNNAVNVSTNGMGHIYALYNHFVGTAPLLSNTSANKGIVLNVDSTTGSIKTGPVQYLEQGAPSGLSGYDVIWGDSTSHQVEMNNNNGGLLRVIGSANLLISPATPTISSGFGTSSSIASNNGTASFLVSVGTGGTATNGVIGLPVAQAGWNCFCNDSTTASPAVFLCKQISRTSTSASIANFNTAGAQSAWVAGDVLSVSCFAY